MPKKLALIHTATVNATTITQLCKEAMPDVEVFNIVDESLLKNTIAEQKLTPTTYRRRHSCHLFVDWAGGGCCAPAGQCPGLAH